MSGRISGLGWNAGGYMNPDISPEVMQLLAERGFNPDGTRRKLDAINDRITSDWQAMGFSPSEKAMVIPAPEPDIFVGANSPLAETGPDPFGAETRAKLAGHNQALDAESARTNALVDALLNGESQPQPFMPSMPVSPIGGFPAAKTPSVEKRATEEVAAAVTPPKPRLRPQPTSYTIKAGDNPTTIARALGISLKDLERKNPGILKKARRLKVGSTLKV